MPGTSFPMPANPKPHVITESQSRHRQFPGGVIDVAGAPQCFPTRGGPLPHLVALRLDTPEKFPEEWKPPQYTVRNLDSVPVEFRGAFSKVAVLPPPVDDAPKPPGVGSLMIPAWSFERGNARVYASPDEYADGEPLVGGGPQQPEETAVEYDVDFPVTADYTLQIRYAAAAARPVDVWLDGRCVGKGCNESEYAVVLKASQVTK